MAFVQVGGDDNLKFIAPHLPCQLYADLMAAFWGDFTGLENLVAVLGNKSIFLAMPLFGQNHMPQGRFLETVDGRYHRSRPKFSVKKCRLWTDFFSDFMACTL